MVALNQIEERRTVHRYELRAEAKGVSETIQASDRAAESTDALAKAVDGLTRQIQAQQRVYEMQKRGLEESARAHRAYADDAESSLKKVGGAFLTVASLAKEHPVLITAGATASSRALVGVSGAFTAASVAARAYANDNTLVARAAGATSQALATAAASTATAATSVKNFAVESAHGISALRILSTAAGYVVPALTAIGTGLLAVAAGAKVLEKANNDFQELVRTGERAEKLDVTPGLVKSFDALKTAAEASGEAMAGALDKAAAFAREQQGQATALDKYVGSLRSAGFLGGGEMGGEAMLRAANTTTERIRAAVQLMADLERAGQRFAMLDLASKLFPQETLDRLRSGRLTAEQLATSFNEAQSTDVVDDAKVQRALDLSRNIERTKQEIADAWKVSIDFSSVSEQVNTVWLRILEAVKAVVEALNSGLEAAGGLLQKASTGLNDYAERLFRALGATEETLAKYRELSKPLEITVTKPRGIVTGEQFGPNVSEMQKVEAAARDAANAYDLLLQRTKDRIEELQLEAQSASKTAEEVVKLKVAHDLERAAKQANITVTADMRAEWDRLGQQMAEAMKKLEQSRQAQRSLTEFKDMAANFASSFARDMASGAKAVDALTNALKSLGQRLMDKGFQDIINGVVSGNWTQAGIGAVEAGAGFLSQLFGGNDKKKKAAQQAALEEQERQIRAEQDRQTRVIQLSRLFQSSLNTGSGRGYLNDIGAIVGNVRDARASGVSGSLTNRYLSDAAQRVINDAQLTGKAFQALIKLFPELRGRVDEFRKTAKLTAEELAQIAQERSQLLDRIFAARNDTSTLTGQLRAFDRQAAQERLDEIARGGHNLSLLERTLAAERLRIIKDFNRDAVEQEKQAAQERIDAINAAARNVVDYLNGLLTGSDSPLSPGDRLSAAQSAYNAQLALAQGGNIDAQSSITKYADDLLKAARDMFASSSQYQDIFNQVQAQLLGLPATQAATDPTVIAVRDAITAIQATTAAVNDNTLQSVTATGGVQTATSGVQSAVTGTTTAIDRVNTSLLQTINQSLQTIANSLASNIAGSTNWELERIRTALVGGGVTGVTITKAMSGRSNFVLDSPVQRSLNKIAWNTYATAENTRLALTNRTGSKAGTFATGGWVSGPGGGTSDSVAARLSNGEFVVRAAVAQMHPWLESFNRTGRMPANDNATAAETRALRAELAAMRREQAALLAAIARAGEQGSATLAEIHDQGEEWRRDERRRTIGRAGRG